MKLMEAMREARAPAPPEAQAFPVALLCGFTPLHLPVFLQAHLRRQRPSLVPEIQTGLYGDLLGNLERAVQSSPAAASVMLEWADLDSRLSRRSTLGVSLSALENVVETARERAEQLRAGIHQAAAAFPVAISAPTLPLPAVTAAAGWQSTALELELEGVLTTLLARAAACPNVRVLQRRRLDALSPAGDRLDLRSELLSDFPYRLGHASVLAELHACLLAPPAPLKGLITDLDDTLWRGLLGEVGVEGVHFDLDHHSQGHGLYQQLLLRLGEAGVLLAVASKNDSVLVEQALQREDLRLRREQWFPVEAHWSAKSESVARILQAWNIGADAVAFVDDSPMELAEVQAAFPALTCLRFPTEEEDATARLLEQLQDLFGKAVVREEDALRARSLQAAAGADRVLTGNGMDRERFLADAEAKLQLHFQQDHRDGRALELLNKTNQFNLNGKRYTEGGWRDHLSRPGSFLLVVTYEDRFGRLGKIAVLSGQRMGSAVRVDNWVMSCRAFARRIEQQCLSALFRRFGVEELSLDYQETPRNGPIQEFLQALVGEKPAAPCVIRRGRFLERCPPLYHQVEERTDA